MLIFHLNKVSCRKQKIIIILCHVSYFKFCFVCKLLFIFNRFLLKCRNMLNIVKCLVSFYLIVVRPISFYLNYLFTLNIFSFLINCFTFKYRFVSSIIRMYFVSYMFYLRKYFYLFILFLFLGPSPSTQARPRDRPTGMRAPNDKPPWLSLLPCMHVLPSHLH